MATVDAFLNDIAENLPVFKPYCIHGMDADALTVFYHPDPYESRRFTDNVTLYTALDDTSKIVGCRIKGIRGLIENAPSMLQVNHEGVELRLIFWAISATSTAEERPVIIRLAREAGDIRVVTDRAA